MQVEIKRKTKQMIHTVVTTMENGIEIANEYTFLYGNPKKGERIKDWLCLEEMSVVIDSPWVIIGDLNITLASSEKQSGKLFDEAQIQNIKEIIEYLGLIDLGFIGPTHTWSN